MAASKPTSRSTPRSTPRRKKRRRRGAFWWPNLKKAAIALVILLLLVISGAWAAGRLLTPVPLPALSEDRRPEAHPVPPPPDNPRYEIFPMERRLAALPPEPRPPASVRPQPTVALIIDDIGYDRRLARRFLDLGVPLTFSILPHSPFARPIAELAHENQAEIMLHLPMEPDEYPQVKPGPGGLLVSMASGQLRSLLADNLASIPYVQGVNNHMGSRFTADPAALRSVFAELHRRGLFFVDSRTTPRSLCRDAAGDVNLAFASRDVFLDHSQDSASIRAQIGNLIRIARRHGTAVGIAHPHRVTYDVLRAMLPELQHAVRLVPASRIVRRPQG